MKQIIVLALLLTFNLYGQKQPFFVSNGSVLPDTIPSQFTFTDTTNVGLSSYHTGFAKLTNFDSCYAYCAGDSFKVNYDGVLDVSYRMAHRDDTIYVPIVASTENSTAVNKVLTAGGRSDTYTVTTKAIPTYNITSSATGGTITPSEVTAVDSNETQVYTYSATGTNIFTEVVIDGTPNTDSTTRYTFKNVVTAHTIVVYYHALPTYNITASATGGTITPDGATTVDSLGTQAYSFSPSTNYTFDSLVVDGTQVNDSTTSYYFVSVTAAHTIHAYYSLTSYSLWYVDRDAAGSPNNGTDWEHAWKQLSNIVWSSVGDADTIYVSGGDDSTTYNTVSWSLTSPEKMFNETVTVCPSWESEHNGVPYVINTSGTEQTWYWRGLSNVKVSGITVTMDNDAETCQYLFQVERDSFNIIDNCHIIGDGTVGSLIGGGYEAAYLTVNNCVIENLPNSFPNDQDPIQWYGSRGGDKFLHNTIIKRNTYTGAGGGHRDAIQFFTTNASERLTTEIAYNIIVYDAPSAVEVNSVIYTTSSYGMRFLIHDNIFAYNIDTQGFGLGLPVENKPKLNSVRFYNNTIISSATNGWYPFNVMGMDTIIVKNNIFASVGADPAKFLLLGNGDTEYDDAYKDFQNNWYYSSDGGYTTDFMKVGYASTAYTFAEWQALGFDSVSSTGEVTFTDLSYDTTKTNYTTSQGRDEGVDLSSEISAVDILDNPRDDNWDLGAIEYQASSHQWEVDSLIAHLSVQLNDSVYDALDNFISHLKDSATVIMGYSVTSLSQIWDVMQIAALPTREAALYDLTGNGFNGTESGSPVYTAFEGYAGDGAGAGVNLNYATATNKIKLQQDSASISIYIRDNLQESIYVISTGYSNEMGISPYRAGDVFRGKVNDNGSDVLLPSTSSQGMFTVSRWASTGKYGFHNFTAGTEVATASTDLATQSIYVAAGGEATAHQYSFAAIGLGIPYELHRVLTNCFETYIMDRWGKGVIP